MSLLTLSLLAALASAQELPSEVERALTVLEEARSLARHGGAEVWPGFVLDSIPLAVFTEDEAFVVHHPDPPEGFSPIDVEFVSADVLRGPRTEAMNANTSGMLGGAVAAFVSIDSLGTGPIEARSVALLVHEAGHAYRSRAPAGGQARWPAEDAMVVSSYPTGGAENNAWGRVEGALLAEALECTREAELRRILQDFLTVRLHRQSRLTYDIVVFEERLELNEGLAEYFARRAVALGGEGHESTPQAQLLGLDPGDYGVEGRHLTELRSELRRINRDGRGASRQRFYATGAAQGLLLDRVHPLWKAEVEERGAALQDLLAEAVGATDDDSEARRKRVGEAHGFERLLEYERAAAESTAAFRRARLGAMLASSDARFVLDLSLVGGADQVRFFDPMNVITVESGLRLHTRMLSLGFEGGRADFQCAVAQHLPRALVISAMPADASLDLDPETGELHLQSATLEVDCATSSWADAGTVLLVRPGPPGEDLDATAVVELIDRAMAEGKKPLPAPPFELADLVGVVHRQPEETPRHTAMVFFSAASWAVPAHHFVRSLREALRPEDHDQEHARLLLVASQCDRASLDALLGDTPGRHVLHDPDRELALRYGVESYPTVVWIRPSGVVESREGGGGKAAVTALVERLRRR